MPTDLMTDERAEEIREIARSSAYVWSKYVKELLDERKRLKVEAMSNEMTITRLGHMVGDGDAEIHRLTAEVERLKELDNRRLDTIASLRQRYDSGD